MRSRLKTSHGASPGEAPLVESRPYNVVAGLSFDAREWRRLSPGDKRLHFALSKSALTFGDSQIAVGKEATDTLDITNVSDQPRYFRFIPPPNRRPVGASATTESFVTVTVSPTIAQLLPGETLTATVSVVFSATSSLSYDMPLLDPNSGFIGVLVKAQSAPSFRIDPDEVHAVSKLHDAVNARVFRATFRGAYVCLKTYAEHFGDAVRADLEKEIALWKPLSGQFVARLIGIVSTPEMFAIVHEWSPLGTLREYLSVQRPEPLSSATVHSLMSHIARGMALLHSNNVVHCNLSSEHVLVFPAGQSVTAKLSDFGRARANGDSRMKTLGRGIRSPAYISPETFENEAFTRASDVYSLGMVFWECTTAKRPFEGFEPSRVIRVVVEGARLPFQESTPKCLTRIIEECWQHDPAKRPTIEKVTEWLDSAGAEIGAPPIVQASPESPEIAIGATAPQASAAASTDAADAVPVQLLPKKEASPQQSGSGSSPKSPTVAVDSDANGESVAKRGSQSVTEIDVVDVTS